MLRTGDPVRVLLQQDSLHIWFSSTENAGGHALLSVALIRTYTHHALTGKHTHSRPGGKHPLLN